MQTGRFSVFETIQARATQHVQLVWHTKIASPISDRVAVRRGHIVPAPAQLDLLRRSVQ